MAIEYDKQTFNLIVDLMNNIVSQVLEGTYEIDNRPFFSISEKAKNKLAELARYNYRPMSNHLELLIDQNYKEYLKEKSILKQSFREQKDGN
jgi:hypothetical protein